MDFGAFFLFGLLFLVLVAALVAGFACRASRDPLQRPAFGCAGIAALLLVVTGLLIYKVYFLDEELYFAAREGDAPRIRALLHRGAGTGYVWESGESTLEAARRSGCQECVKLLQDAGAR